MTIRNRVGAILMAAALLAACDSSSPVDYDFNGDEAALLRIPNFALHVANSEAVTAAGELSTGLAQLRQLLGEPLNTAPDAPASGRREINWDGIPPALTNNNDYPGDFFNSTDPAAPNGRKRGAIFTTPGTGFRISDNDFGDLNPAFAEQFNAFSPARTFIAVGSNVTDVLFRVPGTDAVATVRGFGVVFSDVDHKRSTRLDFYDADGRSLGFVWAPARTDEDGFSLAGAVFPTAAVARVRITSGGRAISATANDGNGVGNDLVIMDDFLYSEPQPVAGS